MQIVLVNHGITETEPYDVLIIDRDTPTIRLVKTYLNYKGYTCKGVLSGSEGIEELKHTTPKLILLGIILADWNGYKLCRMIKSIKDLKHIPIILFTVLTELEVKKRWKETGAEGYILKPFDLKDLEILFDFI